MVHNKEAAPPPAAGLTVAALVVTGNWPIALAVGGAIAVNRLNHQQETFPAAPTMGKATTTGRKPAATTQARTTRTPARQRTRATPPPAAATPTDASTPPVTAQ